MGIYRVVVSELYAQVYEYEAKNEEEAKYKWAEQGLSPVNKKFIDWEVVDVEEVTT